MKTRILPAYIEIMLAAREIESAHKAADELNRISMALDAPLLNALAAQGLGSVLLAQGEVAPAINSLSRALKIWGSLDAPYEAAQVRLLISQAAFQLGDQDTAKMQYEAARTTFVNLKARPDLLRLDAHVARSGRVHGLTSRELEVLRLLATGKTNKTIASEIFVSERTVDRHVSNILAKLGVSSRAAATAFAYEHALVKVG